jgi:hypothetical protein
MENTNKTENQKKKTTRGNIAHKPYLWLIGLFTFAGVATGYAYYVYIGCNGGCPLQSNPYLSMIWGGAMGYLLPGIVLTPKKEVD